MFNAFGGQSMIAPLQRVMVRRPDEAFAAADPDQWHYSSPPDLKRAQAEHDALVGILRAEGVDIVSHEQPLPQHADAIFVQDPFIMTDAGAIILRMGKALRQGEESSAAQTLAQQGIPILAQLEAPATAEGGDLIWLNASTLLVGQGFRTNAAGLQQLQAILSPLGVQCLPFELPYYLGPDACLHLGSVLSIVDADLAVGYLPLMPVSLWMLLQKNNVQIIEVPEDEFLRLGPNVLALSPRRCLMLAGNPVTQQALEAAGCAVLCYEGEEISLKVEGGATCLTRPLLRRV